MKNTVGETSLATDESLKDMIAKTLQIIERHLCIDAAHLCFVSAELQGSA
jgi:hypothetical protein